MPDDLVNLLGISAPAVDKVDAIITTGPSQPTWTRRTRVEPAAGAFGSRTVADCDGEPKHPARPSEPMALATGFGISSL